MGLDLPNAVSLWYSCSWCGDPHSKLSSLLLPSSTFATVRNHNVHFCFPLVLGDPRVRVIPLQRDHGSQGENQRSRGCLSALVFSVHKTEHAPRERCRCTEGRLVSQNRTSVSSTATTVGQECHSVWPTKRAVPGLGQWELVNSKVGGMESYSPLSSTSGCSSSLESKARGRVKEYGSGFPENRSTERHLCGHGKFPCLCSSLSLFLHC